ncbi:MAG: hypothetical protein V4510_10775 [bacterium]
MRVTLGFLAILLLLAPPAAGVDVGGTVANVPPVLAIVSVERGPALSSSTISGNVTDHNGEADIVALSFGPDGGSATTQPLNASALPAVEPGNFTAGWKVWDAQPGDGVIAFRHTTPLPPAGYAQRFNLTASDAAGPGGSANVTLTGPTRGVRGWGPGPPAPPAQAPAEPPAAPPGPAEPAEPATPNHDAARPSAKDVRPVGPTTPEQRAVLASHQNDISWSLAVAPADDGAITIRWMPLDGVGGFQIWRSNSPYILLADVDANTTGFIDHPPSSHAVYKVTYFVNRTLAGGWAAGPVDVQNQAWWDASMAAPASPPVAPPATSRRTFVPVGDVALLGISMASLAAAARRPLRPT